MEYSARLKNDLKRQIRSSVRTEARIEREIEGGIEAYREWITSEEQLGRKPLSVIAEGDSWFRYIIGKAVIYYLEKELKTNILNLAYPGDEVREMLTGKQKARLERELKRGPSKRKKYDIFIFSGGGNDLVGKDRFYKWLHDYEKGMTAKQVLNRAALKTAFDNLAIGYNEVIRIRDKYSPSTQIIFHGYDFSIPDGRGVCGKGPWLQPGLKQRKVPLKLRHDVVKEFMREFDQFLGKITKNSELVKVIPTQGTLTKMQWANELHPTKTGFKKIAELFKMEIAI